MIKEYAVWVPSPSNISLNLHFKALYGVFNWLWNSLNLIPMPLYDLHEQTRPSEVCSGWIQVASAASVQRTSLLAAGSEAEGTCNLTLGETLPPLSTGAANINTKWKVPRSCFKDQFTRRAVSHYSACEDSFVKPSMALEELCRSWENNPDDVIVMSSGSSQLRLGDDEFLTEKLQTGRRGVWKTWKGLMKDGFELHHGDCRIQCFCSLTRIRNYKSGYLWLWSQPSASC